LPPSKDGLWITPEPGIANAQKLPQPQLDAAINTVYAGGKVQTERRSPRIR